MKKLTTERILTIVTVIVIFVAWFLLTATGTFSETIIPSPGSVWESLVDVAKDGYKGHTLLHLNGVSRRGSKRQ